MAVIFDLDGTLIDTRADLLLSVNQVLVSLEQAPVSIPVLDQSVGRGAAFLMENCWAAVSSSAPPDDLVDEFYTAYAAINGIHSKFYDGIVELLQNLHRRGVEMAVCTNKNQQLARTLLSDLGALDIFAVVVGDTGEALKPDPSMLHKCISHLTKSDSHLLLGDTNTDRLAAANAGIAFMGVGYGFGQHSLNADDCTFFEPKPEGLFAALEKAAKALGWSWH